MEDVTQSWVEAYSGQVVHLPLPEIGEVKIHDIAHALSLQCRFNGHCKQFYSVAQHCVLVSRLLEHRDFGYGVQLLGLLHDAAEAYIGDLIRPVKRLLPDFVNCVEGPLFQRIHDLLGVDYACDAERQAVARADDALLATEAALLMQNKLQGYCIAAKPVSGLLYDAWTPEMAQRRFLGTYYRLAGVLGIL